MEYLKLCGFKYLRRVFKNLFMNFYSLKLLVENNFASFDQFKNVCRICETNLVLIRLKMESNISLHISTHDFYDEHSVKEL